MNNAVYIVAGDEMLRIMNEKYPDCQAVSFRDDLSKGPVNGYAFSNEFNEGRAAFWGVTDDGYSEHMSVIMNLDMGRDYILCFGEDDCCQANLKFMIGYLRSRGYSKEIKVKIVDELDLTVISEYVV